MRQVKFKLEFEGHWQGRGCVMLRAGDGGIAGLAPPANIVCEVGLLGYKIHKYRCSQDIVPNVEIRHPYITILQALFLDIVYDIE
jgi:hypothetical protein